MQVTLNEQNQKNFPAHFTVLCSKNVATCLFCCMKTYETVILGQTRAEESRSNTRIMCLNYAIRQIMIFTYKHSICPRIGYLFSLNAKF